MGKTNKIQQTKKALLAALEKSLGVVSTACKEVGCNRWTFYNYVKEDSEFAEAVQNIGEDAIDFVESKLYEKINGVEMGKNVQGELITYSLPPSDTAIIFYLKTRGKARGYVEKQQIEVNTVEGSIPVTEWIKNQAGDSGSE